LREVGTGTIGDTGAVSLIAESINDSNGAIAARTSGDAGLGLVVCEVAPGAEDHALAGRVGRVVVVGNWTDRDTESRDIFREDSGGCVVGTVGHTEREAGGDICEVGGSGRTHGHAGQSGVVSVSLDASGGWIVGAVGLTSARAIVGVGELRDGAGEHAAAGEAICKGGLAEGTGGCAHPGTIVCVEVRGGGADVYTEVADGHTV